MAAPTSAKVLAQELPNNSVPIADNAGLVTQAWRYFFGTVVTTATLNLAAFSDRSALAASAVVVAVDRIYCQHFDTNHKDTFNPDAAAPHVTGHWMRRHTIAASGSNSARLALNWGDGQNGQYFLQTDVIPNLVWWWLSDSANSNVGSAWYEAGHIGYAWTKGNDGSYWQVDEIEPNALQMGGLNKSPMGASDDTLPLTDLTYFFNMGRDVFVPGGRYTITQSLTLKTLGHNVFRGESSSGNLSGYGTSYIVVNAAVHGIIISEMFNGHGFSGSLRDFAISGGPSSAVDGIHNSIVGGNGMVYFEWSNVTSIAQGHGFFINTAFSCSFRNCVGISYSNGCGFVINGGPAVAFFGCQAGGKGLGMAAFRSGNQASFYACNTAVVAFGTSTCQYGYLIGMYPSFSGTAQGGGASTITLAAAVTAVTDQLVGRQILLTGGTGGGQGPKIITAYNSGTKVATVDSTWNTNPNNTTTYTIQDPIAALQLAIGDSTAQAVIDHCNAETITKNGIRTVCDSQLIIRSGRVIGKAGYEASVRIAPNTGTSQIIIEGLDYDTTGSAANEVVSEGVLAWAPGFGGSYLNVVSGNVEAYGAGTSTTFSHLPAASAVPAGTRGFITDSNTTVFHATAAGGSNNKIPVVSDNNVWLVG